MMIYLHKNEATFRKFFSPESSGGGSESNPVETFYDSRKQEALDRILQENHPGERVVREIKRVRVWCEGYYTEYMYNASAGEFTMVPNSKDFIYHVHTSTELPGKMREALDILTAGIGYSYKIEFDGDFLRITPNNFDLPVKKYRFDFKTNRYVLQE